MISLKGISSRQFVPSGSGRLDVAGSLAAPGWWGGWRGHEPLGTPPPAVLPGPLCCPACPPGTVLSGPLALPCMVPLANRDQPPAVLWFLGFPSYPVPRRMGLSHRSPHDGREGVTPFPGLTHTGTGRTPSSGQGHAQPETPFLLSASHPISLPSPFQLPPDSITHPLESSQVTNPCLRLCILRNWAYDNPPQWTFQGQG